MLERTLPGRQSEDGEGRRRIRHEAGDERVVAGTVLVRGLRNPSARALLMRDEPGNPPRRRRSGPQDRRAPRRTWTASPVAYASRLGFFLFQGPRSESGKPPSSFCALKTASRRALFAPGVTRPRPARLRPQKPEATVEVHARGSASAKIGGETFERLVLLPLRRSPIDTATAARHEPKRSLSSVSQGARSK